MKNKVLITGGIGNLGSWISEKFFNNDFEVFVTTRKSTLDLHPYNEIVCDITDLESLQILKGIKFNYVIHLASYNEFFEENYFTHALKINTEGTYNLIKVLNKSSIKGFIYFSTAHVYGSLQGIINEKSDPNPLNDYASTHLFAECITKQYCDEFQIPYTIFRLSNSYGCPKLFNNSKWYLLLNDICKQAFESKSIKLNTNGKVFRDFIWMGDVSEICLNFIKMDLIKNNVFNLSSGKSIQIIDIAKKVQDEFEKLYCEKIEIRINARDTNCYPECKISNKKLKQILEFSISDEFSREIQNIFYQLETKAS